MKLKTIALAATFALGPTLAFAQAGGANSGAATPEKPGMTNQDGRGGAMTTGQAKGAGRSTGSDITTGSNVPQDEPNLSNSPASSDTSRRVK